MIEWAKEALPFAKLVWPIVTWLVWVDRTVRQNQRDVDRLYAERRGGSYRDRSIRGRVRRALHGRKST